MDNYYKLITSVEYNRLLEKKEFNIQDVKLIAKSIPTSLEMEFDSTLKPSEKKRVFELVCRNIYTVAQVYHTIIQNDNESDYLITKEYINMCKEEVGDDDSKLIPLKASYIFTNGTGRQFAFQGEIPKKGFFSNRQTIANDWIDNFIKHLGWHILSHTLSRTNISKDLAVVVIAEFIACFLVNTYPDEFDKNSSVRDINFDLSRI